MASISWSSAVSGNWASGSNWEGGTAPGSSDDAFVAVAGGYTVSLTSPIMVASLTISDASASLQVQDPGGNDAITGDLANSGFIGVDTSGAGGSTLAVGGTLTSTNGLQVGNGGMTAASLLTVGGAFSDTGGVTIAGGQAGAAARMVVAGASPGTLVNTYAIEANGGGASLQWGSGGITQIGDGASAGGDLFLDGAKAFAELGATNSNSALTNLSTIASNGLVDLRDGANVTTATSLTVNGGDGRLKIDAFGGTGGSDVTIGGDLTNSSSGSFGDGGVAVGNGNMTVGDTLTVDGTVNNAGGILDVAGGQAGAAAELIATGAAPGTLTGQYNLSGDGGGAILQWASGGITQIGDGASNGGGLFISGTNAFAETGATNSNSALSSLATIASNGLLDLRNDVTVTTTGSVAVSGGSARLKVDAYGGSGGGDVTIGGDLVNSSSGSFGDGGVSVGNSNMTTGDTLTVDGTINNTGGILDVAGGQTGAQAEVTVTGAAPSTLTGQYNVSGDGGGAILQWAGGGITQIGDGASNGGGLFIDGANAFAEVGATNSNSALDTLTTIAGNGLLDLRDDVTVATAAGLTVDGGVGRLKVDAYGGSGGSDVTVGGNLVNSSSGSFGDGGVAVGNGNMTTGDTLTVDGTVDNTGGILDVAGGQTGAEAQVIITGTAQATLTGQYNVSGDGGGATLQWGSGGITQIGDGAGNGGGLFIDGADAFAEVGATGSNSALTNLATIAGNGLLDLRDGVTVATADGLTVDGGDGRLKVDAYGGGGGGDVTIGGDLVNGSSGSFGDGGVAVGNGNMTADDTLTVDGTIDNTSGILDVTGGQKGAEAEVIATGAVADTLTGQYNLSGGGGGAVLQWGSGGITQIGDGASNGGGLFIDGSNAFAQIGATNSNSALTSLTTIAGNGLLDLRDGVTVATAAGLTVNGGVGRLKVDAYGGAGGSKVTIGGDLVNGSSGSFGDGGVAVGGANMTIADTLAVDGTIGNTGGILDVSGGQAGAEAELIATGAAPGTLTGQYNLTGDAGGAVLQWGSGGITQIGDGTSNGGGMLINGGNAFAEVGATNSNSALTNLATIAGNGLLDVRAGTTVTTSGNLTVEGGVGRLKVDAYGGSGGSDVTIGGNLLNSSPGSFGDGGVDLGIDNMSTADALTVDGTVDNTGGILDVTGGQTAGATAHMTVTGAVQSTLTGTYNIVAGAGGAVLQWGSGGITQIGDGASNGADLFIDGTGAFAEVGATNSNSALTGLNTIAGNGLLDVRDGTTLTTTGSLTVDGGDGRLKVDSYGGNGGTDVTIGGDLENESSGSFGDGGVAVGRTTMNTADTLTVQGAVKNDAGAQLFVVGNNAGVAAGLATLDLTGAFANAGGVDIGSNGEIVLTGTSAYTQSGGLTDIAGTLSATGSIALDGGVFDLTGGTVEGKALDIASGASLEGFGTVATAITSAGSVVASGGSLDLAGGLASSTPLDIGGGAALELAGADTGGVTFTGSSGIFSMDDPVGFTGTISGLAVGDTLVLRNTDATSAVATFDSGTDTSTLAVKLAGGGTLNFILAGNYAGEAFGTNLVGSDTEIGAVGAAVGEINTTLPVSFGTVRQGAAATVPISITNNAPAGSAALDVSVGGVSGGASGTGTIAALAPGATDSTDIKVGIGSGATGVQTGTVTLDFASDLGSGNEAPLPSVPIAISGTVYREAVAAISPLVLFAHVGDAGVETLNVGNVAAADGFSEDLIAQITSVTGGFTVADAGPTGDIAPGASNAATLTLDFSTAQAGVVSGNATVLLTSDGGTGAGSIDGLGTVALPSQTIPISIDIDSFATAAIQAPADFGTLSASGSAATLDLGTIAENSGPFDLNFGVANTASGPADVLSGSFAATASNGFSLTGLTDFSDLQAGQTASAGVTIDTTASGVITQTITLNLTDSNAGGFSAPQTVQTLTITGTVEVLPPPTITVATTLATMTDVPALIGLSVGDPNVDTLPITVTITDTSGGLTATQSGSATVSGNGTNRLTLTGDLTDINNELDTVAYTAAAVGSDTIDISVEDQHHAIATQTVAVATSLVPDTAPVINTPTLDLATAESISGLGGLSVNDPSAMAGNGTLTLTFLSDGPLTITGSSGATITGNGTDQVEITGTVPQIDADLSDGLEGLYLETLAGAVATANAEKTLISLAQDLGSGHADAMKLNADFQKLITPPDATDMVAALAGSEGAWFVFGVEAASYAINSIIAEIPGNEPPESAGFLSAAIEFVRMFGEGTHVVAPGGVIYSMDAVGEFVLAASTQTGDSLLVEVRLQPVAGSNSTSEITQVAASVGTDRVTFEVGRQSIVWVDGAASKVGPNSPVALNGGTLSQISADVYQVTYNTGEVLTVTVAGTYLDVQVAPGANNKAGTIVGLANWTSQSADVFTLPGGSVLAGPLTQAQFYGEFVNAWRVPQSLSLFDYGAGQTTATFTDTTFPQAPLTLAGLPASVIAQAQSAVAAAGITDPGAVQAAEFDYIASGGNPATIIDDANQAQGITTTAAAVTPSAGVSVSIGVMADQPKVITNKTGSTPVVFDVYLTGTNTADTTVDYDVVAAGAGFLDASAFGGALPSGSVTIAAGQVESQFTINLPQGAMGNQPTEMLAVAISSPDGSPLFVSTAQDTINQQIPGPPPVPTLVDLTNLGSFVANGNNYVLDLGQIQAAAPIPPIQFEIENAAASPSDALGGTFTVDPVEGFTVSGASLPGLLDAGASYQGLVVTATDTKFGENTETITFDPTDSNNTGFTANLAPITLTIEDTVVPPTMVYSYAWGDVHIITYNGLTYNFQAAGEFTLAKSRVPNDSFDIQMRLVPWSTGSSVTVISQVAVSVGTDKVTFDQTRADTVYVDGNPSTITQANPVVSLDGGKLTQISPGTWQVTWNTGEEATITSWGGFFNISDGIPLSEPDLVGGLQGEDAGAANDFQLANGTVLPQPLTSSTLYGEFADSWRVSQASSLFDYLPGQTTATFTNTNFPADLVSLSDLPTNLVTAASTLVANAGITDPNIAADAELDYIATDDPTFITAASQVSTQVTNTQQVPVQVTTPPVPAVGIEANPAGVTEAASGPTATTFDAYLTNTGTADIVVDYTVVAAGAGFFDAATFGGSLPSGSVTIAAGATLAPITIDVPQGALGSLPSEQLEVQVSAPGGTAVFAPDAIATVVNPTAESGVAPVPQIVELSQSPSLIENGPTAYTLNLGTLTQGQSTSRIQLGIANTAAPAADELSGTFGAPAGSGFIITGNSLPGAIVAGSQYDGLYVDPQTTNLGTNTETLIFNPTDVNDSGFVNALSPITLTVTDTVAPIGVGQLNTPQTIVFPNVHVGTSESQALNVSNTGAAPISVSVSASDPIMATGSIASLGANATDKTDLSVGVDTSTAGDLSGAVSVNFGATDPQVDVFGDVFRLASGTVAPVNAFVHVGAAGTLALDISNTATADGFSENLLGTLASVTGNLGIAAAGPTSEIAAGSSDTSSLLLDFSTSQPGTIIGSATVDQTSDGGTGTGSIDGLGTTALTAQVVPVAITVENFATAAFENLSAFGTFTQSGTAWSLNLGTVSQGSGTLAIDLGILNAATGLADALSGSLTASGSSAFATTGTAAFSGLGAGQADTAPQVILSTGTAGTFTETITLAATGSDASGFSGALPDQVLTVTGTVAANASGQPPAIADVSPASPINLGNVHVGDTADQTLSISNTATSGAASLDGSVGSLTGDATGSGTFTGLAPGAPASTAISVGVDTSIAGSKSGDVSLAFISDNGSGGLTNLPNQAIAVTGTVYREADAALLPLSEIVHVGDPGTANISVSNKDAADGFSESLIGTLLGASDGIGIGGGGPTGDIVAGGSSTLGITFSTASAGTISGTGTIGLISDGGTGAGSIDGLGQSALPDQTVPVSITVDNFANPDITSDGNLTSTGTNAFTLDLGSTALNSGVLTANLNVLNNVAGPADSLSGTVVASGDSEFSNTGFGAFGTIGALGSVDLGGVSLATNQTGVFHETVTLTPTDSNTNGFSETLAPQTVTVVGTITPAATAVGDVHMLTYDGLHYDFQADGSFVLTRSTVPSDSFQIQIQAAADPVNDAASLTVLEAARVGADVVTFGINRASTVWVDGAPDTSLNGAGQVQTFDGGQIQELSATTFQLFWSTGQTLTVTNQGLWLDSSVMLGAAGGPGSVQGLLGTDSGNTADDFQLPDGTVLQQPLSAEELLGAFAEAWSVTGADSLLGGAGAATGGNPTISPITVGASDAGAMQFIYGATTNEHSVLQAKTPGQVLSASAGVDVLSDAGGAGAIFRGTLAGFAHELLAGVSAKDLIDVTNLASANVTTSYAGSNNAGVLHVSGGTQSGELYVSGQLTGASFRVASDGHGGSLISLG